MAAEVAFDVVEQILIRLDVKDIIRCKSVCKSWQSLMSTLGFVKAHMKHAYKKDGQRRIRFDYGLLSAESSFFCNDEYVVGSCNGLVCVSPRDAELVVTNPWTRESQKLPTPPFRPREKLALIRQVVCCWGFGYDMSTDDYKVIVGLRTRVDDEQTLFHVLTLKSNTWKVIEQVEYQCFWNKSGILCGGALHWFMRAGAAKKKVIMSLDLSTEECKEIPQPSEAEYECADIYDYRLGVIEECLCLYSSSSPSPFSSKIWVMKNNKWELYNNSESEGKYDVAHCMIRVEPQNRTSYVYTHDGGKLVPSARDHIYASLFARSLVSPHQTKGQVEGNDAKANIRKMKMKMKMKMKRSCKHKRALIYRL